MARRPQAGSRVRGQEGDEKNEGDEGYGPLGEEVDDDGGAGAGGAEQGVELVVGLGVLHAGLRHEPDLPRERGGWGWGGVGERGREKGQRKGQREKGRDELCFLAACVCEREIERECV